MEDVDSYIRRANSSDAGFLARVMLSASRAHLNLGLWDLIIGGDEAACLDYLERLASAEPRSLCHYSSFIVAEFRDQRAAALCGFETAGNPWAVVGEAMSNVQRDLGWDESRVAASYERVAPVWACSLPDAGADFAIENVATLPEFRRHGLADLLLDVITRDGIVNHRCSLAQITSYIGNHAAQAAYEKADFKIRDERRCADMQRILGVPGFVRLTRDLKID